MMGKRKEKSTKSPCILEGKAAAPLGSTKKTIRRKGLKENEEPRTFGGRTLDRLSPCATPVIPEAQDLEREAEGYVKGGQFDEGITYCTTALEKKRSPQLFTCRASCYYGLNQFELAIYDAQTALDYEPNSQASLLLLKCSILLGDTVTAEKTVASLRANHRNLNINSQEMELVTLKALIEQLQSLECQQDYRTLLVFCGQALHIARGSIKLRLMKAEALLKLNKIEEAIAACSDVLKIEAKCVQAEYLKAICYYLMDNLDESIELLEHASKVLNTGIQATFLTDLLMRFSTLRNVGSDGDVLMKKRKYTEARHKFMEYLTLLNDFEYKNKVLEAKVSLNLSIIEEKCCNLNSALKWVNKSIELNSDCLDAVLHRAHLCNSSSLFIQAVRDYKLAKVLDPGNGTYQRLIDVAMRAASSAKKFKCSVGYYLILGIDSTATLEDIKNAYKKQALIHHPDKHAKATEEVKKAQEAKFKRVVKAYETLSNSTKRLEYDKLLRGHGCRK